VPVAIVGGGASGTIVAAQLARRGIRSALIDGSGRMGRGVAYSTTEAVHLLNVRAEGMSALAGEPDHFASAFEAEGGSRRGFAPRRFFATYLGAILNEAATSGFVELIEATASSAQRHEDGWHLGFSDGSSIGAEVLVLAIGNQEPEGLAAFAGAGSRFIGNPWGAEARAAVVDLASTGESALLVGTGLTMVDLVLSLEAAGYSGRIVALSRRGLAPRGHADFEAAAVTRDELPRGLRSLFRWLRRRSAQFGWRAAVDSLRPYSHALWQEFSSEEHQRFLRHARPWWDVHRHRIAPEVAATVARMVADGRLEIVAGRILSAQGNESRLEVEYRPRGSERSRKELFAYAFNCTGPLHSIARSSDPLLRSLLDQAEIRPDHLGIGLDVDETNRAGEHLWAMGPLTKGRYWEIIAVPDIREQAAHVADAIERKLCA
jgi:uncharacterized NAD(P)/FAD-binding protein YdhS